MAKSRGQQRAAQRAAKARLKQPKRRLAITDREIELSRSLMWFVLMTKPQSEIRAEKVVSDMMPGVFAFTPRLRQNRRMGRVRPGESRYREVEVSAFPRYLFIGVPEVWGGLPWHSLAPVSFLTGYIADQQGNPYLLHSEAVAKVMQEHPTQLFKGRDREEEDAPFCEVLYPCEDVMGLGVLSAFRGRITTTQDGFAVFDTQTGPLKIPFEMLQACA